MITFDSLFKKNEIIFVADFFIEDYVGGAELTSEALIQSSKRSVEKIHSHVLTEEYVTNNKDKFWVFGNFSNVNPNILNWISENIDYVVLEYDYKFCKFRSPELHLESEGNCNCSSTQRGRLVEKFLFNSLTIFWMSNKQQENYLKQLPALADATNVILSSVFAPETIERIHHLRNSEIQRDDVWVVLGSNSWVKGQDAAVSHCKQNKLPHDIVWNVPYEDLLKKLRSSRGFVYLPAGADTCPRMVIEAKLLGCEIVLNDNVQHASEDWFNTSIDEIEQKLLQSPKLFWDIVEKYYVRRGTISGYTTTYNCKSQSYPFEQCIQSMLGFCDEVCVVDGGSTDGTWERLIELSKLHPSLKLKLVNRDWNHPRFALFDGQQKAEARSMCTSEFCWQMDSDEIVHPDDYHKAKELIEIQHVQNTVPIYALPVIEYWGSYQKIRCDVTPWKWRLSKNLEKITHGVPGTLRVNDEYGYHALQGTDGCDMIYATSLNSVPCMSYYQPSFETLRRNALSGNVEALKLYENLINKIIESFPCVFHYSWVDLERKIKLYKNYWTKHWESLTGNVYIDSSETNMMFDVPWSSVTDEMIQKRADELKTIGGWIWHKKWNGEFTPWISVEREPPIKL